MKISFVIPAHNEEKLIGTCLEAVRREIESGPNNTTWDAEVFVVNNASTDDTRAAALKVKGVSVVEEPLKGLVMARRAGFVVSTGELIANIDADVILKKGWLARVMREFSEDKELVALSGPFIYYDLPLAARVATMVWYFIGWIFFGFRIQGGNFVLRRDAWEKAGGFDTSIAFYGEDTDVARRLKPFGTVLWDFRLSVHASGRRLKGEGVLQSAWNYGANFVWVSLTGKPFTHQYQDIRPE